MTIEIGTKRSVLIEKHTLKNQKKVFLLSHLDGCSIIEHNEDYFYVKNGKVLFHQKTRPRYFYIQSNIWQTLELGYNMKFEQAETQICLMDILQKHIITNKNKSFYKTYNIIIGLSTEAILVENSLKKYERLGRDWI